MRNKKRNKMQNKQNKGIFFDFEVEKIILEINKNKFKFVGLQFPDGLRKYAVEIAKEIEEKTDAKTFIFFDPIYGACDTKSKEAEILKLDLIVHFGHEKL